MEKERRGIAAWLRGRIHAISVVIGNLAARIILGKKGFNEAYQMNLKNSIAEEMKDRADAYKERQRDEPAMEREDELHADPENPQAGLGNPQVGSEDPQIGRLRQMAMEQSAEIIKIMEKAAPELKEDEERRVEIGNLDLIISKAGESGEPRAVIQEKGQDGQIIMSSQDLEMEDGNGLRHPQEEDFSLEDVERHVQDEEILKDEERREEQVRQEEEEDGAEACQPAHDEDIFAGFLEEDVPEDALPMEEGTLSVLDMNIQDAQESEQDIGHGVADAGCQDIGDSM